MQETPQTPSTQRNQKKMTSRDIIIKLPKTCDKENNVKAATGGIKERHTQAHRKKCDSRFLMKNNPNKKRAATFPKYFKLSTKNSIPSEGIFQKQIEMKTLSDRELKEC